MGNQPSSGEDKSVLPKIEIASPKNSVAKSIESPSKASIRQQIRDEVSNSPKVSPKSSFSFFSKRNSMPNAEIPKIPQQGRNSITSSKAPSLSDDGVDNGNDSNSTSGATRSSTTTPEIPKVDEKPKQKLFPGGVKDPLEISPQRRLHFLDVAVGASGALTKRVFEVRERVVKGCPKAQNIILDAPQVVHVTTSMIIVRWEADNWADAKQIGSYELQWCQPDLEPGSQFAARTQVTSDDGAVSQLELFCDHMFCTVSRKAIQSIDTRNEVIFYDVPGGCKPIIFRVRAKVLPSKFEKSNTGGWCTWSPVSAPTRTLSQTHASINPEVVLVTSHLLQLVWQPPPEELYGKVVNFQLFGRHPKAALKQFNERSPVKEKSSDENDKEPSDPHDPDKHGWVLIREQQTSAFTIGVHESAAQQRAIDDPHCDELLAPFRLVADMYYGLPYHLLPAAEEFEFYILARTGSWFHGTFYYNELKSDIRQFRTLPALPDSPEPPFILPYHGTITRTSVELRWKPPTTYGNGHSKDIYTTVYGTDLDDWFGLVISPPKLQSKESVPLIHDWNEWSLNTLKMNQHTRELLRGQGWELREGDATHQSEYWSNILTGESSWTIPPCNGISNLTYMVLAKPVEPTPTWNEFQAIYQGTNYKFVAGGKNCPISLRPGTEYEFKLLCENRFGKAPMLSLPLRAETIPESSKQTSDTEPDMPRGWVECWDSGSEYCYYYNEKSGQTQWTHPSGPRKDDPNLPFRKKRFKLMYCIRRDLPPPEGYGALRLVINRKNILKDSFDQLSCVPVDRLKLRTNITFEGEDGIDSGGITNEWYMQLSKAFFDSKLGLMQLHEENRTYSVRKTATDKTALQRLRFLGRIMGKAVYDKRLLDLPFSTFIYKQLVGQSLNMDDLFQVDPLYHTSLQWMLSNDIEYVIFETFSVSGVLNESGEDVVIDLIPGGRDIDVTNANKKDYVNKMVEWHLSHSIKLQMDALLGGFHEIVPSSYLSEFDVLELKLLFNGSPFITVRDLRKHVVYKGGYNSKSKPVEYFWEVFREMSQPERSEVLSFITGCPKVPLDGFTLQFVKSELGPDALPTSHTCFNQLVLPEHETKDQLLEKLKLALENAQGFTMS